MAAITLAPCVPRITRNGEMAVSLPVVSIITPVYNHERYIGECIESVIRQTYTSWEMIVVDDGSTDGTWDLVQRFASSDPRIRVIRQGHVGIWRLSETYNKALRASVGQLVAVLEGDDLWPANKLEIQVDLHLKDTSLIFSYGRVALVRGGKILSWYGPTKFSGTLRTPEFLYW